jgi:hypothetical protein
MFDNFVASAAACRARVVLRKVFLYIFPSCSPAADHTLGDLPAGLIFDVLVVPGSEQLSTVLEMETAVQHEEEEREKEPFLVRLLARF